MEEETNLSGDFFLPKSKLVLSAGDGLVLASWLKCSMDGMMEVGQVSETDVRLVGREVATFIKSSTGSAPHTHSFSAGEPSIGSIAPPTTLAIQLGTVTRQPQRPAVRKHQTIEWPCSNVLPTCGSRLGALQL